jgi:glucose-6-phosphate isomerase
MPATDLQVQYANVLGDAIGAEHGLQPQEIRRVEARLRAVVRAVETERMQGEHRYRDLPTDAAMVRSVDAAVRTLKPGCENLVVLGIGGSALGNIALQTALNPPLYNLMPARGRGGHPARRKRAGSPPHPGGTSAPPHPARVSTPRRRGPRLFVMDNVDPVQFGNLLDCLDPYLHETVFNVISKSGETAETAAQFLIIRDLLTRRVGAKRLARQLLVTTDPESGTLRELADAEGWHTLRVPEGVGGRFSVLSAVGLFSAAMCGIKIRTLLAGAARMSERAALRDVGENPAAMLALLLHAFYVRGKRLHVMFPYAHQLAGLADWYRQLWAESLGKNRDREGAPVIVGPTPIRALGATDQHSQVQLYREGPNDKVFIFLDVEKFARDVKIPRWRGTPGALKYLEGSSLAALLNAEKRATEYALVASKRPCLTIRLPQITEDTVGQFIMLWEATTTLMGRLLNVNPYDQPAVQMGKDFTFALMGQDGYQPQREQFERFANKAAGRHRV